MTTQKKIEAIYKKIYLDMSRLTEQELTKEIIALIDSAKREGAIEEMKWVIKNTKTSKLFSGNPANKKPVHPIYKDIYEDTVKPLLLQAFEDHIAQLEQSKEEL